MERIDQGLSESESADRFDSFNDKYAETLRDHVDLPGEQGLKAARDLGRAARENDLSMLQLVGIHLEVRRAIVVARGIDRLVDMDAFLSAALAAYDVGERAADKRGRQSERDRLEWLRGLSDAYIAIASGATLEARVAEVCVQSRRFLGAVDARLEFGHRGKIGQPPIAGDEISASLLGSAGLLTVTAEPARLWTDAERVALQQLAALISAPVNDARRLEFAQQTGRFGALLGGVADPDDVLERFHSEGIDCIGADRAIVWMFDEDRDVALPPGLDVVIDQVARTGEIVHVDPGKGPDGTVTWAVLPLGSDRSRIGVLAVGYDEPQPFDEVQTSFLADIAERLLAAIERSRAYASERTSRREAEHASARLRDLQGLATDLARAATRRRVAQVLLRRAVVSAGAVGGFVAVFTSYPQADVLAATGPFRTDEWADVGQLISEVQPWSPRREAEGISVVAVESFRGSLGRRLTGSGFAQLAWEPVRSGEREIGILVLAWSDRVEPREVDRDLLRAQVAMAGSTLQRAARYDVEHTIANTLQRSLLALPPLTTHRVRWSVLYRAGSVGLAGGDWYDLVEIDDDRLGVVIGDIVGRGVEAAASMGQLRSATRALATQIDDPAEVVAALDHFARNTGQGHFSSLAYVVLDTRAAHVSYSIAGHPPPIVVEPGGPAFVLEGGLGPLLGMSCTRGRAERQLAPGTRLVMYTDGLVDRRGESIDVGIDRLVGAVAERVRTLEPDEACRDLVEHLIPARQGAEARDDVALVVVELAGDEAVDAGDLDQPADDARGGDDVE